eukprot:UN30160
MTPVLSAEQIKKKAAEVELPHEIVELGTARCQALTREFMARVCKCSICLRIIGNRATVWNCNRCHVVFHLRCIQNWAETLSKKDEESEKVFRCPNCNETDPKPVLKYLCFCRKYRPEFDPTLPYPHSCGNDCSRERLFGCPHRCKLQCHPGPCPPCKLLGPELKCPCG